MIAVAQVACRRGPEALSLASIRPRPARRSAEGVGQVVIASRTASCSSHDPSIFSEAGDLGVQALDEALVVSGKKQGSDHTMTQYQFALSILISEILAVPDLTRSDVFRRTASGGAARFDQR